MAGWIVGTNHFCACQDLTLGDDEGSASTLSRFSRITELVEGLVTGQSTPALPDSMMQVLADDQIERRHDKRPAGELITAYANVACPASGDTWYTFGGYPAASAGNWQRLEWPWPEPPDEVQPSNVTTR